MSYVRSDARYVTVTTDLAKEPGHALRGRIEKRPGSCRSKPSSSTAPSCPST